MQDSSESINLNESNNDIIYQVSPLKALENSDETVLEPEPTLTKLSWLTYFCECFRFSSMLSTKQRPLLLPLQSSEFENKITLVLDLDETLVHSSFQPIDCQLTLDITINDKIIKVYVQKRPGLDKFLQFVSGLFEVIIFTASLEGYARPLLDLLDPNKKLAHYLYRESCTLTSSGYLKDLSRLGRPLNRVLIVDVRSN